MSWRWKTEKDDDGLYWKTVEMFSETHHREKFVFYQFGSVKCAFSQPSGRLIINEATKLDPLRCQLYRLVYGSLP